MPDALSRLLDDVRPRGVRLMLSRGDAPVPVGGDAPAPLAAVVVLGGAASVEVEGAEPQVLGPGDLALGLGSRPVLARPVDRPGPAELVTVTYDVEGSVCDRVLGGLPPLVVAPATPDRDGLLAMLAAESRGRRPGGDAVVDRLTDLVVVTALREWLAAPGTPTPAWVAAGEDPVVGAALRLMHDAPATPWTLATLAGELGVSRSTFAKRFTDLLGEPPMGYLTCWRLCLAADLLRTTDLTLASVAQQVGYANPYAFSSAFHRLYGVRPGRHRALSRGAPATEVAAG